MNAEDINENYVSGWIKIFRSIRKHWIWKDPVKFQWWIDILLEVNHNTEKIAIGYKIFDCYRGQSLNSVLTWANRWGVSKKVAYSFLKMLEKDSMISLESVTVTTRLTVLKYESYQQTWNANGTQGKRKGNAKETQGDTNNKYKNKRTKEEEDILVNFPFDDFWNLYDKKLSRKDCEKKWGKLKDSEKEKIMQTLPDFLKTISDKKFQPYPTTYLNNRRWEDELTQKPKSSLPKIQLTPEEHLLFSQEQRQQVVKGEISREEMMEIVKKERGLQW